MSSKSKVAVSYWHSNPSQEEEAVTTVCVDQDESVLGTLARIFSDWMLASNPVSETTGCESQAVKHKTKDRQLVCRK